MAWRDLAYKAPGSGTPLKPADLVAPDAAEIADRVIKRLIVPRSPARAISVLLGAIGTNVQLTTFNSSFRQEVIGGPGIIRALDAQFSFRTNTSSAGLLSLVDGTNDVVKSWPFSAGANFATPFTISAAPVELPFLEGLYVTWTVFLANGVASSFNPSLVVINIDYDSIPIGQRVIDNV